MSKPGLQTVSDCCSLFQYVSDAVAVFSSDGGLVFANEAFKKLDEDCQSRITESAKSSEDNLFISSSSELVVGVTTLKKIKLSDGFAFIVSDKHRTGSVAEDTLKHISMALQGTENVYFAAAQAIHECLGWRWVAITRFVEPTKLQVLAFSDKKDELQMDVYDVAGTPCELVVDSNRFTLYSDLLKAFPEYQALHDMGALTYAGLVYRGSDNRPLGHVMVMDDKRDVDFGLAEDVISSVTLALSSHFQLQQVQTKLREVESQAHEDGLTGIGNRHAFDKTLEKILSADKNEAEQSNNYSLAVVDLDYLKYLNDNMGHQTGDRFIQMMAQELSTISRQSDSVFRIGGDEFIVILKQSSSTFLLSFYQRFRKSINRIRSVLRFPADASIGIASLHEAEFDTEKWIALADKRMYQDKQSRRQVS